MVVAILGAGVCNEIVIQPAYYLSDRKIVKQFTIVRPSEEVIEVVLRSERPEGAEVVTTDEDIEITGDEGVDEDFQPEGLFESPEAPAATEVQGSGVNVVVSDFNDPKVNIERPDQPVAPEADHEVSEIQTAPTQPRVQVQVQAPDSPEVEGLGVTPEATVQRDPVLTREPVPRLETPEAPDQVPLQRDQMSPHSIGMGGMTAPTIEDSPDIRVQGEEVVRPPPRPLDLVEPEAIEVNPVEVSSASPEQPRLGEPVPAPPPRPSIIEPAPTRVSQPEPLTGESVNTDVAPEAPENPELPVTRPKARPEIFGSAQAVESSLRPRERPDRLENYRLDPDSGDVFLNSGGVYTTADGEEVHIEHGEETTVSAGHFHLPSIDPQDENYTTVFSLNSGMHFPIRQERVEVEDRLLDRVLNQEYHQSFRRHTNGHLEGASQLNLDIVGARVNPSRRDRQWGSGLTTHFIEYVSSKFEKMHDDSPICVNNISKQSGGYSGHSSHRNGLDVDIAYPSNPNPCRGRGAYFTNWVTLKDRDPNFYEKNWDLLKFMLVDDPIKDRVRIIFSDRGFMRGLCNWAKENNKRDQDRVQVLEKLYHETNHHHHYHIRLKCNGQNKNCDPSPYYTNRSKIINPNTCRM